MLVHHKCGLFLTIHFFILVNQGYSSEKTEYFDAKSKSVSSEEKWQDAITKSDEDIKRDGIGLEEGKEGKQGKRRGWRKIFDFPANLFGRFQSVKPKAEKQSQMGTKNGAIFGMVSQVGNCMPGTSLCYGGNVVQMVADDSDGDVDKDEKRKRKGEEEMRMEEGNKKAAEERKTSFRRGMEKLNKIYDGFKNARIAQTHQQYMATLKEKAEERKTQQGIGIVLNIFEKEKKARINAILEEKARAQREHMQNVQKGVEKIKKVFEDHKKRRFVDKLKEMLEREREARFLAEEEEAIFKLLMDDAELRYQEAIEKEMLELVVKQTKAEEEERQRMAKAKHEENVRLLCHKDALKLLGRYNWVDKKVEEFVRRMKALGEKARKRKKAAEEGNGEDGNGGQKIIEKNEKKPEKETKTVKKMLDMWQDSLDFKSAIRFALRSYFCEQKFGAGNEGGGSSWKREGTDTQKWMENNLGEIPVERMEKWFYRDDPKLPHQYRADFKFSIFFPAEFEQLWALYDVEMEHLLVSLTSRNFRGFKNPAKSGSWMATSWDGEYFLKTVQVEPKFVGVLEDPMEKDFFFNLDKKAKQYKFWSGEEQRKSSNFKGGFAYYYRHMLKNAGKETLLPKFSMLFAFQEKDKPPALMTIQNGLFPDILPDMNYKFDLKGSSKNRKLATDEALKKLAEGEQPIWMDMNFIRHRQMGKKQILVKKGFFPDGIEIEAERWAKLKATLEADSKFLANFKIVDYSLLVGVHFEENGKRLEHGMPASCANCSAFDPNALPKTAAKAVESRVRREKRVAEQQKEVAGGEGGGGEEGREGGESGGEGGGAGGEGGAGSGREGRGGGGGGSGGEGGGAEGGGGEGDGNESESDNEGADLVVENKAGTAKKRRIRLFIGIIDILQSYNAAKHLEDSLKNAVNAVGAFFGGTEKPSVFHPNEEAKKHSQTTIIKEDIYQERFVDFLTKVVLKKEKMEESNDEKTTTPNEGM